MPQVGPSRSRLCAAVVGVLLILEGSLYGGKGVVTYTDHARAFEVEYPRAWFQFPDAKGLYITNFSPERAIREILLPNGGALITFAFLRPEPVSLDMLIQRERERLAPRLERTFAMSMKGRSQSLAVTEFVSASKRSRYTFEEVDWYFSVDGKLFDAALLYHASDMRHESYRGVLSKVVASIRLTSSNRASY